MSISPNEVPFAGTVPSPKTENEGMITGSWRTRRPILDADKCTECLICWISCPDSSIKAASSGMEFNLKYCKGCGICNEVCPVGAISLVPELDFED